MPRRAGNPKPDRLLAVNPADLTNLANAAQRLQQKLNFLGTRTSGADFALSVLQQQAARQYAAVLTLGDYF